LSVDATFRLDSVSKQFTAMAIMLLKEGGRLAYDDPISRYLPELSVYPGVTIRHLLTHTGGLPEYYDEIVKTSNWPSNADARHLLGQMAKPMFPPGSRYEYSNPCSPRSSKRPPACALRISSSSGFSRRLA
jgi:CubicO group peptidase (beta-lactamase class C family)